MEIKKIIGKTFGVSFLCLGLLGGVTSVYASSISIEESSLFDKSEITEMLAENAENSEVVADKNSVDLAKSTSAMKLSAARSTSTGTYPTRRGVILVTADAYKGLIPTGHAAIVVSATQVIESLSDGVQYGKNNWYSTKDTCYGVTCGSTSVNQDSCTVNRIEQQGYIGLPYNFNYLNVDTRSKFYCSQLVWAAYKDALGIDLNTSTYGAAVHPLELVNSTHTVTIYSK